MFRRVSHRLIRPPAPARKRGQRSCKAEGRGPNAAAMTISWTVGLYSTISPQRRGDERRHDQPHALLDPDRGNRQDAGQVEHPQSREAGKTSSSGNEVHPDRRQSRHQPVAAVQPEIKVLRRSHVRRVGVKLREHLANEQKNVDDHRHLDDPPQREQGVVGYSVPRKPPHDLERKDNERRAGRERERPGNRAR